MHRKITSIVCAALFMILCIPSVSVSATSDVGTINGMVDLVDNLGIGSEVWSDDSNYIYVSGKYTYKTYIFYVSCVSVGSGSEWDWHYNLCYSDGTTKYFSEERTRGIDYTTYSDRIIGQAYYMFNQDFFGTDGTIVLTDFCTNDPDITNFVFERSSVNVDQTIFRTVTPSSGSTFSSIAKSVMGVEDPIEPTSSGGFQLPDEWLNGGQTLETAEPVTFENVDMSQALSEFEEIDATVDDSVLDAIGVFWYIFDLYVSATDLLWLVVFSMFVVLLAWFLGRRV